VDVYPSLLGMIKQIGSDPNKFLREHEVYKKLRKSQLLEKLNGGDAKTKN